MIFKQNVFTNMFITNVSTMFVSNFLFAARMRLSQDLFRYYSKDGKNDEDDAEACIDCNGLVEVMLDTMSNGAESITLDESKKFMARIDLDNDMLLQSNEFYNFLFIWNYFYPTICLYVAQNPPYRIS